MSYQDPTQFRGQMRTAESVDRGGLWVGLAFLGAAAIASTSIYFPDQAEWLKTQLAGLSPTYQPK